MGYFLTLFLLLKNVRASWDKKGVKGVPGASRLTDSHALGYCMAKVIGKVKLSKLCN
jgi:hypothetical protein